MFVFECYTFYSVNKHFLSTVKILYVLIAFILHSKQIFTCLMCLLFYFSIFSFIFVVIYSFLNLIISFITNYYHRSRRIHSDHRLSVAATLGVLYRPSGHPRQQSAQPQRKDLLGRDLQYEDHSVCAALNLLQHEQQAADQRDQCQAVVGAVVEVV